MKTFVMGLVLVLSASARAYEPTVVNCAKEAQQITMNDILSSVKARPYYSTGTLQSEVLTNAGIRNVIYMDELDLDNETVSYKTTLVAKVTSSNIFRPAYQLSECTIRFNIEGCEAKLITCSSEELE